MCFYIIVIIIIISCSPSDFHISLLVLIAFRHCIANMAEATIALSIPGLFLTCVQYFTLVRLGPEFTNDFGSCLLRLRATELRLHRWGRAAGITDERSKTFVKQLQNNYTQEEITFAHNACNQIAKQLRRAKEDSEDMMDMNHGAEEPDVANELERMNICAPEATRASRALKHVKLGYERSLQFTSKAAVRGKWAFYKKTELTTLLAVIGEHVATLEGLFPEQERSLAAREAASMKRDAIKVLASITTASDPLLAEALKTVAPQHGFSWDKIESTGYATIHLDNSFRDPHARHGPARWDNITSGDFATVRAGWNYGYETVAPLQSAFGPNPQPHTAFAAMNDPDWPLGRASDPLLARGPTTRPDHFNSRSRLNHSPKHQNDQVIAAERVPGQVFQHVIDPEATHGTKSSPHQLDPPHPLIDRSDVYDDIDRSSKSSVTAPEMYGTSSKPFQDSTGFSSVGDNPTQALSSATGLETHDLPEREYGSIERDCSDDDHAADTMSIHTDGREHNLDPDTKLSLAEAFAGHIVENLTPQQLNDLFDQRDAIESIAGLIGDFSVLLGVSIADDDARSSAVTFVRHQRTEIAKELASVAKAWRPSTEGQVSIEEKLKMLHFGDTEPMQYDDPNLGQDSAGPHQDEDQLDQLDIPYTGNDTPELRDVVLGKKFVLGSEELPWMIDRIRRHDSLLHTGKIFSSVRSGITRAIESNSEHVEFSLGWDIVGMLNQQYEGESRSQIRLSDMIVYNGTPSMCYASTTLEYVKRIWPALGTAVIDCFDRALVGTDGTSTLDLQDSRLHIKLDGATTKVSLNVTTEKSTSQSRIQMLEVRFRISTNTRCHDDSLKLNRQLRCASGWPLHAVPITTRSRSA